MAGVTRGDLALAYADLGYYVHPLAPGTKDKPIEAWPEHSSRDAETIRKWWSERPEANIGIHAGKTGILAIDPDTKNGGIGPQVWRDWTSEHGVDPGQLTTMTPTGGEHWLYQTDDTTLGNRTKVLTDVDTRAGNGYVVAPGSRLRGVDLWYRDPEGGFSLPPVASLPVAPPEVLALAAAPGADPAPRDHGRPHGASGAGIRKLGLAELLADPPQREGSRDDWLTKVAGHLARTHRDDYDRYAAALADAASLMKPQTGVPEMTAKVAKSIWQREQAKIPLDDSQLAEWTAERLGDQVRWVSGFGWMEFDGRVWSQCARPVVIEAIRELFLEQHRFELATADDARRRQLVTLLSRNKISNTESLLQGIWKLPGARSLKATDFDNHPDLLNVANGVVDLRTGELQPHNPDLLLTKITEVEYHPDATHADWEAALGAIQADARPWLQTKFGQAASGHQGQDDLLPILQGDGSNGKSTVLAGVTAALGLHAVLVSERVLLASPSDHPTELMDLKGARLAWIEETPEGRRLSVKRLKDTVGSPWLTARRIRQDPVKWKTTHSLFLTTNYKLQVAETDHGTWRRLALVRFPYTFWGDDDPRRPAKFGPLDRPGDATLRERVVLGLDRQHEAALAWVVAGAVEWYRNGQVMPPLPASVHEDTLEWRCESDLIMAFILDCVTFGPTAVKSQDLFNEFTRWLGDRNHGEWSEVTFTGRFGTHSMVTQQGVEKKRANNPQVVTRRGDPIQVKGKAMVWRGVAFQGTTLRRSSDG